MSENKPKKSSGKKMDEKKLTYIFFGILIVGIIIVTVFVYMNGGAGKKKYVKDFGENITTTIELTETDMNMTVQVGETEITQHGTLTLLEQNEEYTIYEVVLEPLTEEEEPETVQMKVYEDSLLLAYETGEIVEYEVK